MENRLSPKQLDLLGHLGQYGILTPRQATLLQSVGLQTARKRLRKLEVLGLVESRPRTYGRGQPAPIYRLSKAGLGRLRSLNLDARKGHFAPPIPGCRLHDGAPTPAQLVPDPPAAPGASTTQGRGSEARPALKLLVVMGCRAVDVVNP